MHLGVGAVSNFVCAYACLCACVCGTCVCVCVCVCTNGIVSCLYSSVVESQSCKLKDLGSISSGGSMCGSAHINTHKATDFDTEDSSPSRLRLEMPELIARCFEHRTPLQRRYQCMDTLGIEPRASRMLSGCDTTTPCAQMIACQA